MESQNQSPSGAQTAQPSTVPTSAPVQTLLAYSAKRASVDEVVRALISYRGWFVPVELITQDLLRRGEFTVAENGQQHFNLQHGIMLVGNETRFMPGEFWIFTDADAVQRAQAAGALLGMLAKDVAGTELFRLLDPSIPTVRVNPGSPAERAWYFKEGSATGQGKLWADAILLEEKFAQWNAGAQPDYAAIFDYPAFLLFDHAAGSVVTLPNQGGMINPAVAFTAPDCAESFLSKLGAETRAQLKQAITGGKELFDRRDVMQIDGLLINPFGPGEMCAFPFSQTHK